MRRHTPRVCAALVGALLLPMLALITTSIAPASAVAAGSAFHALAEPQRLADTRDTGALARGGVLTVTVTGDAPLPTPGSIVAAVLNVTVVGPAAIGYWTVYPHNTTRPMASSLNVDGVGAFFGGGLALANMVTVPVGPSGTVDIFTSGGGDVVVDMLGSYTTPAGATTSGRFVPLAAPSRMLDTRNNASAFGLGETRTYALPAAVGAASAVLNVTTIGNAPGPWVVFPGGTSQPATSNLNTMYGEQVVSNQVIVPVDASGRFSVFSAPGGDLILDVIGTFTGIGAPSSTEGLFVPLSTPTRFFDSRDGALNPLGGGQRLLPGWDVEVAAGTNTAINRNDVLAVVLNLTVTDTFDSGYISVTPAGSTNPAAKSRTTSSMNVAWPAQTLAHHVMVPVSARGFDIFAQNPTHALADVSGFYIGTPLAAPFGAPQNVDPTPVFCAGFSSEAILGSATGATGPNIALLQQRLLDLGFWNGGPDGSFGWSTQQAVMAYQKWNHLTPRGYVDAATARSLNWPNCRPTAGVTNGGDLLEVDKGRQVGLFLHNGKVVWALNVSTGGGYYYEADNALTGARITGTAITDNGTFHVYRVSDQAAYKGTLGTLYRPRFVVGGIAVHGAPNVPSYPASHGCIRVSNPAMDMIWATNLLPMGATVVIHD